ncbi:MAG: N-acetylmuramoyl-L-alanine amidase, partial [Candidatus Dormibacteraeota bacterium]|nr:N-acetylmuramoyl-L-alanine amidase [Candidatus Dormibacteraeota bacterium]
MSVRPNDQWARDIDAMHQRQGWAVIGYNFLVFQDGAILEGAGLMTRGIHSPPVNTSGFGVCFCQPSTAGGTPLQPMSQAMRNSGRALYEWLSGRCGRRLTMTWHGATFATACPGPDVRRWVQQGMPSSGAPTPTPA